jgi:hypothetical protein
MGHTVHGGWTEGRLYAHHVGPSFPTDRYGNRCGRLPLHDVEHVSAEAPLCVGSAFAMFLLIRDAQPFDKVVEGQIVRTVAARMAFGTA